ncbi:MAG: hypothetical protein ACWA5X_05430 [bacterium]
MSKNLLIILLGFALVLAVLFGLRGQRGGSMDRAIVSEVSPPVGETETTDNDAPVVFTPSQRKTESASSSAENDGESSGSGEDGLVRVDSPAAPSAEGLSIDELWESYGPGYVFPGNEPEDDLEVVEAINFNSQSLETLKEGDEITIPGFDNVAYTVHLNNLEPSGARITYATFEQGDEVYMVRLNSIDEETSGTVVNPGGVFQIDTSSGEGYVYRAENQNSEEVLEQGMFIGGRGFGAQNGDTEEAEDADEDGISTEAGESTGSSDGNWILEEGGVSGGG